MKPSTGKAARGVQQAVVYDMTGNLCVWSRAGVIKPTACMDAYDCLSCPLDRKLKQDIAEGRLKHGRALAGWQVSKDLPHRSTEQKKCRHMLSGRVSVKYCVNDYDCEHCAYHRMIEDAGTAEPLSRVEQTLVSGFALARNYYYHEGHTWARVEYGGRVRVGLDDFASRLFGPLDAFQLPGLGATVGQGEPGFGMVRGNLTAGGLSPLEGVVVAVNPKAAGNGPPPEDSPYDDGWLMVIEPVRMRGGLRNLFFEEEGLAWMEDEVARLTSMIAEETGYRLAATGGRALGDIYGRVPGLEWDRLRSAFLRT
ncbi:MAG: glycine cleavage system protein H [Deltaproteobacteria bacterium]|nr:glycine cleavage system protein H [Deltaproteobacteria bacterium]